MLEILADKVEQHDGGRLGVFADDEGADGRDRHEEGLVEQLPFEDAADGFPEHFQPRDEQGNGEYDRYRVFCTCMVFCRNLDDEAGDEEQSADDNPQKIFIFPKLFHGVTSGRLRPSC